MSYAANYVRKTILERLRSELKAEITLANKLSSDLTRYDEQMRTREIHMTMVHKMPLMSLNSYGLHTLLATHEADIRIVNNLRAARQELLRSIAEKQKFIDYYSKMQDASIVKDFRPICLIGSVYKIIAKILANRLVVVLRDLVHEVQSAFIANRQILDSPFILDELIHWCKSKKKQSLLFKVDFEKAYDSVRWDYLDDILNKFGFGSKWRLWISNCLTSSKGSILVNGSPTSEFYFRKGLKQGDPLSPFLFLLIMETLHLSFQNLVNAQLFKGNINTIIQALECFHKASGLRLNLHKSKIMGISVNGEAVCRAANKMGCNILKTPFSYLGVKVGGSMARIRMTLLKSVLSSTPIYHMSLFKVPSQVLKSLEGIRRKFFNGADLLENKMAWFKWDKVLMSKAKGGLGVSSFFALNRALLFKWIWRFHNNSDALWSKFIRALHGNCGGLVNRSNAPHTSVWRSIISEIGSLRIKGVDLMQFLNKKVGSGLKTSFWEESWRGDMSFKAKFPRVFALESDKKIDVATKMSHNDLGFSLRRSPRDGVELEQFTSLNLLLAGTSLSLSDDRWIWSLVGSGEFSVASARKLIDDSRFGGSSHKTRWIQTVPVKINILAWKVRSDFLPTRLNLSRRGIEIQSISCPCCNKEVESSIHIFFRCPVSGCFRLDGVRVENLCLKDYSILLGGWFGIIGTRLSSMLSMLLRSQQWRSCGGGDWWYGGYGLSGAVVIASAQQRWRLVVQWSKDGKFGCDWYPRWRWVGFLCLFALRNYVCKAAHYETVAVDRSRSPLKSPEIEWEKGRACDHYSCNQNSPNGIFK
ncbi:RNA-directed DNA polymerase, eukaryota [Tanacetum coccineum]